MRRRATLIAGLCLPLAGSAAAAGPAGETVYIGTNGEQGIYSTQLDETTGALSPPKQVIPLSRAQWLAFNPTLPVIYAVGATKAGRAADGLVYSLAIDPATGGLRKLNEVDVGGREPTHLVVDPRTHSLFAANHDSGSVSVMPMLDDGAIGPVVSLQTETGSGPVPVSQDHAVAHGLALAPDGRFLLVADRGADRVFVYHFNPATRALTPAGSQTLPAGSGPRHLAFDRQGRFVYVLTELNAELHVFAWDGARGTLAPVQSLSTYPAGYAGTESRLAAEVALSRDGRFLYATLRAKQNSIVVYAVDARTGKLREIQRLASGGDYPVCFGLSPSGRWLLVSNSRSNSVRVMKVDPAKGVLRDTATTISIPEPESLVFSAWSKMTSRRR